MSIEVIALEHFSALPKADSNTTTPSRQHHAVFQSFLCDDSEQDSATTIAHSKSLSPLLKYKNY